MMSSAWRRFRGEISIWHRIQGKIRAGSIDDFSSDIGTILFSQLATERTKGKLYKGGTIHMIIKETYFA
jgi:hypothetical protein